MSRFVSKVQHNELRRQCVERIAERDKALTELETASKKLSVMRKALKAIYITFKDSDRCPLMIGVAVKGAIKQCEDIDAAAAAAAAEAES